MYSSDGSGGNETWDDTELLDAVICTILFDDLSLLQVREMSTDTKAEEVFFFFSVCGGGTWGGDIPWSLEGVLSRMHKRCAQVPPGLFVTCSRLPSGSGFHAR